MRGENSVKPYFFLEREESERISISNENDSCVMEENEAEWKLMSRQASGGRRKRWMRGGEGMQTLEIYGNRRIHQSFEKLPRMSNGRIRGSLRVFVLSTKGSGASRRIIV